MYFPTSVVISFHIFHGELSPGPDGSSPALSSRGRFPDRLARAPLRGRAPRPDPGAVCVSLPGDRRFPSSQRLCLSFGRIFSHSTRWFFKGKLHFQAPPEQRGLPKIRVTNGHAGNVLGSLNAVPVPSVSSDEAQMGTALSQITAYRMPSLRC